MILSLHESFHNDALGNMSDSIMILSHNLESRESIQWFMG